MERRSSLGKDTAILVSRFQGFWFCSNQKPSNQKPETLKPFSLNLRKKRAAGRIVRRALYFCPTFCITTIRTTDMENIQNSRGKGYCILYFFMGLFFFTALMLMLYFRNSVLDFPR